MKERICDTYEYQERAAIREFDGGFDRIEANQLALIDIKERNLSDKAERQKQKIQQPKIERSSLAPAAPDASRGGGQKQEQLEALRQKRELISKEMKAEADQARRDQLFKDWMDLNNQILDIKFPNRKGKK